MSGSSKPDVGLRRERVGLDRAKALYWRELKLSQGPAAGVRLAEELRQQVIARRPDWPDARDREEDLRAHLEAIDAFTRVPSRTG